VVRSPARIQNGVGAVGFSSSETRSVVVRAMPLQLVPLRPPGTTEEVTSMTPLQRGGGGESGGPAGGGGVGGGEKGDGGVGAKPGG